ncbi:MAG: hypothetical protein ACK4TP_14735 [Hyphomicrobium sp.]
MNHEDFFYLMLSASIGCLDKRETLTFVPPGATFHYAFAKCCCVGVTLDYQHDAATATLLGMMRELCDPGVAATAKLIMDESPNKFPHNPDYWVFVPNLRMEIPAWYAARTEDWQRHWGAFLKAEYREIWDAAFDAK